MTDNRHFQAGFSITGPFCLVPGSCAGNNGVIIRNTTHGILRWRARCRFALGVAAFFALPGLVSVGEAAGQTEDSAEFTIESWRVDEGMPHNAVTAVLPTADGYLWVGTSNGLARFDGLRFTTFRLADYPGLKGNRVLCLFESARGEVWVGTQEGGVACYRDGQFSSFGPAQGLTSDTVLCLGADREWGIWAGTPSGLNRLRSERVETYFKHDGLPDDRITAVFQPASDQLLLATGKGLARFNGQRFMHFPPSLTSAAAALALTPDGRLWVGGEEGLYCWPRADGDWSSPAKISSLPILCLVTRQNGELWFGGRTGQLGRVNTADPSASMRTLWNFSSPIAAMCEDQEGNLWIGSAGEGLHRLKPRQLHLTPLPGQLGDLSAIHCFETAAGELRLVAGNKDLYAWRDGRFRPIGHLPLPAEVVVQTVAAAAGGGVWVGTEGDGLFLCSGGTAARYSERDGLSENSIQALCADEGGGLWLATRNGGLNHVQDRSVQRFNTPWGFTRNFGCVLTKDSRGCLWIGTNGDGLFRLERDRFVAFTEREGLPSGEVRALRADPDGTLWVGTAKGLCRLREGKVATFPGRHGLSDESIVAIRADVNDNLWLGTGSGIFRANKRQLHAFVENQTGELTALPFGKGDGLPVLQCLPTPVTTSPCRDQGGIWFLTSRGLVASDPGRQPVNPRPPPVVIEEVWVENQNLPFVETVRVAPGKEKIQFQFTALSLTAPEKLFFRYQLKGIDRDWSEPTTLRQARYPKLPPGNYRFWVVACNNDGVWNEQGASVALMVLPFWWETAWFRLASGIVVLGLVGGFYRLRHTRRRELERMRARIASDLHDDVGSSLWSITLLARLALKYEGLQEQQRRDINEIHRIAQRTSNSIRDIIWLINPAFDTIQDLALRTRDFACTALRGVDYRLHCDAPLLTRKLPLDFRQNLLFMLKEILTNIARHAQASIAEVRIEEHGRHCRLSVRDNGVGFDPGLETSGNGLRNLKTRANQMGAELNLTSRPGQGTSVVITCPIP